jgi:hypothetical protein
MVERSVLAFLPPIGKSDVANLLSNVSVTAIETEHVNMVKVGFEKSDRPKRRNTVRQTQN